MIPGLGGAVRQKLHGGLIIEQHSRTLSVDPRLELTTFTKMKSVQKCSLVDLDRSRPSSGANCIVERPQVDIDEFRIQPELLASRDYELASELAPDRVDSLIQCVSRTRGGAFRPEVGLDTVARHALLAAEGEDREQTQRPVLLRRQRDGAGVTTQGKRSEKLEDQHSFAGRSL